ncbi:MAG: hypothetical protein HYX27_20585 [Acidobacteria bacterium]|nr:hypothetical protein [Acidobacteriota bacterium]
MKNDCGNIPPVKSDSATVQALLEINIDLLRQAVRLLESMDDMQYRSAGRFGPQLRHILEFYECFLAGRPAGIVDYDARRRDELLEANREEAVRRINALIRHLSVINGDGPLQVRMEEALLPSSASRELQVLASHTTHHFALIAMIVAPLGHELEKDFGVARSTLRYRTQAALCAQ